MTGRVAVPLSMLINSEDLIAAADACVEVLKSLVSWYVVCCGLLDYVPQTIHLAHGHFHKGLSDASTFGIQVDGRSRGWLKSHLAQFFPFLSPQFTSLELR